MSHPATGVGTSGGERRRGEAVVALDGVHVVYRGSTGGHENHALRGVSLHVARGETLGVVGESGCGKSTLARTILRLVDTESGRVTFRGTDVTAMSAGRLRPLRRHMQMVFQDPIDSLNPRWTVRKTLAESLRLTGADRREWDDRIDQALGMVGLEPQVIAGRQPHELSGGQAQRVGIARALLVDPDLIVLDEPTSALDVTVQAQILDLIRSLVREQPRTYVYISHDLATVRAMCSRVAVLYLGEIVELGTVNDVFENPLHPYTRALLSSVPSLRGYAPADPVELDRDLDRRDVQAGCPLTPRCPFSRDRCVDERQQLTDHGDGHLAACWRIPEISQGATGVTVTSTEPPSR